MYNWIDTVEADYVSFWAQLTTAETVLKGFSPALGLVLETLEIPIVIPILIFVHYL